jgi:hypothetical protein
MALRVAAVVLCLVLAGCGALGGTPQSTATERVTPAPVPEATPSVEGRELVPGLRSGGLTSADELASAHRAAVANRSYTLRGRWTGESRARETLLVVESEYRYRYQSESSDGRYEDQSFVEDATRYTRQRRPLGVRYSTGESVSASAQSDYLTGGAIEQYLTDRSGRVSVVDTTGGRRYELVTEAVPPEINDVVDYRVEAMIHPDGFVSRFDVSYRDPSTNTTVGYTFTYSRVGGTTVERPDWVERQWPEESTAQSRDPYDNR